MATWLKALQVECPVCFSSPGAACRRMISPYTVYGVQTSHQSRIELAQRGEMTPEVKASVERGQRRVRIIQGGLR